MEGSLAYLVAALVVVWLGIISYLVMLSGRLGALQRELDGLKRADSDLDDHRQN